MKTVLKWPGGKSREVDKIQNLIPAYDRYIEPFFGGGAVFFHLTPQNAVINDISPILIRFYRLIKAQDKSFYTYLLSYNDSFQSVLASADRHYDRIKEAYFSGSNESAAALVSSVLETAFLPDTLFWDKTSFQETVLKTVLDKFSRTKKKQRKAALFRYGFKRKFTHGFLQRFLYVFPGHL